MHGEKENGELLTASGSFIMQTVGNAALSSCILWNKQACFVCQSSGKIPWNQDAVLWISFEHVCSLLSHVNICTIFFGKLYKILLLWSTWLIMYINAHIYVYVLIAPLDLFSSWFSCRLGEVSVTPACVPSCWCCLQPQLQSWLLAVISLVLRFLCHWLCVSPKLFVFCDICLHFVWSWPRGAH